MERRTGEDIVERRLGKDIVERRMGEGIVERRMGEDIVEQRLGATKQQAPEGGGPRMRRHIRQVTGWRFIPGTGQRRVCAPMDSKRPRAAARECDDIEGK